MKRSDKTLGVSGGLCCAVILVCVAGILLGSFLDLPINARLAHVTKLGSVFAAFALACAFVVLYGYNRIHMTNHFLTDVCFGTLITYLIFVLVSRAFLKKTK